jgi:hypothetical protein
MVSPAITRESPMAVALNDIETKTQCAEQLMSSSEACYCAYDGQRRG